MPVIGLDHVNVRTADVTLTLAFFRDVLGMAIVPPPGLTGTERSGWVLDQDGRAAVHVGSLDLAYPGDDGASVRSAQGSGAIDHFAFNCSAYVETRDRLKGLGLAFTENHVREIGLRQLFVREANGILIELNFRCS